MAGTGKEMKPVSSSGLRQPVGTAAKKPKGGGKPPAKQLLAAGLIVVAAAAYTVFAMLRPAPRDEESAEAAAGPLAPRPRAAEAPPSASGRAAPTAISRTADGGAAGKAAIRTRRIINVSSAEEANGKVREILAAFESGDAGRRSDALDSVESLAEAGKFAVEPLIKAIPVAPPALLNAILEQADRRGWKEAAPFIVERIGRDGEKAGSYAFLVLGRLGTDEGRACLRKLAGNPASPASGMAWRGLSLCATEKDLEPALAAIENASPPPAGAIETVARLCSLPSCTEKVEKFLEGKVSASGDAARMKAYAAMLEKLPSERFFRFLEVLAAHQEPSVRTLALSAMAANQMGKEKIIMALANDPDRSVKAACIAALKRAPCAEAAPALVKIMAEDPNLANLAQDALCAAFGIDLGGNARAWKLFIESGAKENDPGRRRAFEEAQAKRQAEAQKAE
jgi:hypothetical protein